ncbi:unnamed protein product, partial [marine sediment metagenome]
GSGTFDLQNNCTELKCQITFENLTTNLESAHIHKGAAGSNGPVVFTFNFPFVGLGGTINGLWTDINPDNSSTFQPLSKYLEDLKAGNSDHLD